MLSQTDVQFILFYFLCEIQSLSSPCSSFLPLFLHLLSPLTSSLSFFFSSLVSGFPFPSFLPSLDIPFAPVGPHSLPRLPLSSLGFFNLPPLREQEAEWPDWRQNCFTRRQLYEVGKKCANLVTKARTEEERPGRADDRCCIQITGRGKKGGAARTGAVTRIAGRVARLEGSLMTFVCPCMLYVIFCLFSLLTCA